MALTQSEKEIKTTLEWGEGTRPRLCIWGRPTEPTYGRQRGGRPFVMSKKPCFDFWLLNRQGVFIGLECKETRERIGMAKLEESPQQLEYLGWVSESGFCWVGFFLNFRWGNGKARENRGFVVGYSVVANLIAAGQRSITVEMLDNLIDEKKEPDVIRVARIPNLAFTPKGNAKAGWNLTRVFSLDRYSDGVVEWIEHGGKEVDLMRGCGCGIPVATWRREMTDKDSAKRESAND